MMGLGIVAIAVASKIITEIQIWFYENTFMAILLMLIVGAGIFYGIKFYWRMKNPEKHQRNLQLDSMLEDLQDQKLSNSIIVGRTIKDRKPVSLTTKQRTGHVQIIGATGRGKTKSIIVPWFARDMKAGRLPILIDGKGDSEIVDEIKLVAQGNRVVVFDPTNLRESCTINPLDGGSAMEIADRLFCALEFESSYYKEVQYSAVLSILEAMEQKRITATLSGIYKALMNPGEFIADAQKSGSPLSDELLRELTRLTMMKADDREEKFSGILSQLRPFTSGTFSHIVNGQFGDAEYIELDETLCKNWNENLPYNGLIILLPTMQYQKSAKVLGRLVLQTLAWATSKRCKADVAPIFIDEFSSFVFDGFEQFLNKARSKGVALHLSHQSVGDLEAISPSFAKTVNVNTNVKVLLGLNDPDTADYFARHLGTNTTTKETERMKRGSFGSTERTGEISVRTTEEFRIHPNRLKSFSNGQGVLSVLVGGRPLVEEVQFDARVYP